MMYFNVVQTEGTQSVRNKTPAVAYYRTSSAANVGGDKDSLKRQQETVRSYAKARRMEIVREFYDAAVSGADPIDARPGFVEMLDYMAANGAKVVLVENASRFARDLAVQIAGHDYLKAMGFDLIPADAPDFFTDETPTAVLVRQVLGAISQFEKATLVAKLKAARDRKRVATGRCEGRKPPPTELVKAAKRLARRRPKGGKRSLRQISRELADLGHLGPTGKPYSAEGIRKLLKRAA